MVYRLIYTLENKDSDSWFLVFFLETIMIQQSSALHDVEKHVGEWFRLSNQRKKRVEKNST